MKVVILGCGYTGQRVLERLRARGVEAIGTHRRTFDVTQPPYSLEVPPGAIVLHSIPILPGGVRPTPLLLPLLAPAVRVVYLSTTGVYGATHLVDETTPVTQDSPRAQEERDAASGAWQSLILRPAAIYGPGRGVHVSMREGRHKWWGDGSNYISRIHVDDFAAICEAALLSGLTGAYPVADEDSCTAREITEFTAELLNLPMPAPLGSLPPKDTRSSNRRVDGRAIARALGITLSFPSYRVGLPDALSREFINAGNR